MRAFDQTSMEYSPEMGTFEAEQFEWGGEAEWGGETEVFHEAELTELAHELLSVTNEAELDRFLGDLIKKAGSAIGGVIRSPIGQAVGGYLKGAAKRALPLAGGALGGYIGGPLGAKIGSGLASAAGSALGLEAESVMGEDREVEGAKTFARMAGDAVKGAVAAPPSASPAAVAQGAVTAAAQKHAPGLLRGAPGAGRGAGHTGRWVRRGSTIVIELSEAGPTEGLSFELETSQPTLRQGSRGSAVTTLQARLQALRFDPGPIDGIFGSQTASAVRAFQSARRIQVDGVVGPQTWGALYASEAPPPLSPWTPRPGTGSGRRPVHLTVPFYGYQSNDKEGCFQRCTEMAAAVGVTVGGPDVRIQVAVREDTFGRVTIDSAKAHEGLAYIDAQLDARHPVVVGVSYAATNVSNVDDITDHFVIITTRGANRQRGVYYGFHDPARSDVSNGGDQNPVNRFYATAAGWLYRPASSSAATLIHTPYDVSMVRRNV